MRNRTAYFCLLTAVWAVSSEAAMPLEIYLPRTVRLDGEVIELGQVGLIQGPQELAGRAKAVPLGRFSVRGQQITLDRATIESCLAGSGISPKEVRLSGAERVVITRNESSLSGSDLVAAARAFLESQTAGQEIVIIDPEKIPQSQLAEQSGPFEVVPLAGQDRIAGKRMVVLSLRQEGREVGRVPVHFVVRFRSRQAVAASDIAAGQVIRSDQIRFEIVETKEPQTADAGRFVGMAAKRSIAAGSVLSADWVQPPTPPVLVQRRQRVFLKLDTGPMLITASGEAMDEGAVGQVIRVKRGQRPEERIVLGTVMPDGSVKPLLGKGL